MPLPSSGPISLSQVNTELGRSASATLNMNNGSLRSLFGVPSGQISMSQGRGKSNVTVSIPAFLGAYGTAYPGQTAAAEIGFWSNGNVTYFGSGFGPGGSAGSWINNAAAASNYWIRFTQTSSYGGSVYTGAALGVWHQLNSNRYFSITKTTFGAAGRYFTVEISTGAGASIVATRTGVSLEVEIIF